MKLRIACMFLSLNSMLEPRAQTVFQETIVAAPGTEHVIRRVHTYPDGSILTEGLADSMEFVLTRFTASGAPLWMRAISYWPLIYTLPQTASTPDGGFVAVASRTTTILDSALIDIIKLDASGATAWARSMVIEVGQGVQGANCSISVASTGHLFIVAMRPQLSTVSKLDPSGNILWNTQLWSTSAWSGMDQIVQAEPLDDGGCAFLGMGVSGNSGPVFSLGRLDQSGELLWAKTLTYNAAGAVFEHPRLVPNPTQEILVSGPLSIFGVGAYHAIVRVDTSGQLERADLYESLNFSNWQHNAMVKSLGDGAVVLSGGDQFSTRGLVLMMDQTGAVLSGYTCTATSIGQVEHSVNYLSSSVHGDTITWVGNILAQDTIFGTEEYIPLIWRTGTDLSNLCAMDPFTVPHYAVPPGVITTADVGDTASVAYGIVPFPVSNDPLPLPIVGSYCGLVGVAEEAGPERLVFWPNPSYAGASMNIQSSSNGSLTVFDASGRALHQRAIPAGTIRMEHGLGSGAYWLQFVSDNGRTLVAPLIVH